MIYILLFSCTCARVHFFTCYCPTCEKLGSTRNFLLVRFFVAEFVNWKNNGRILSAILLICILLKIKKMRNSVTCRSYNCCRYRIRGKTHMNEKKIVFQTAEKEDVTVDVHIYIYIYTVHVYIACSSIGWSRLTGYEVFLQKTSFKGLLNSGNLIA